jgi:type II secretory pathway component PulC
VAGGAPTAPAAGAATQGDDTLRYRLGLEARRVGARTAGFTVRPGVSMPALERAGLRPGDVILSVNGSGFDEERMLELEWELANTPRTEFEVERSGRRIRLSLDRNS